MQAAEALARAMIAIATNEAEARAMSAASLRLAREQYAWGPIGERLLTDLEAFLASRAGQPGA